tara:strand:+ start:858 stop:1007 length:150 start_codon:yes stop_codon:yes gene_type:complete
MKIEIIRFNTETKEGFKKAIAFEKENPNYKLISSRLDFDWYYEKNTGND